jgi:hypothetical protein
MTAPTEAGDANDELPAEEETAPDDVNEPELVTSDASLTLEEARPFARRRGATLVLLLGEVGTGKSTLLAELWNEFMAHGEIGETGFAGSVTSLAFEERTYDSRIESDRERSGQRRTQESQDGYLHVRVQRGDGALTEVFLTDITGEHFTRVREGTPLAEELSDAARVDRFTFLVDGAAVADAMRRENVYNWTRRLIRALKVSGCLSATARTALVLTKQDLLTPEDIDAYTQTEARLLDQLLDIDASAQALRISARPKDGSEPAGLGPLVAWFASDDKVRISPAQEEPNSDRAMSWFQA